MIPPLPRWTGTPVVCIGSGPSLTPDDCERVRASGLPAIVTNSTFRACPWADALFGFDFAWFRVHLAEVRQTFAGRKFCQSARWPARDIEWPGSSPGYRSFGNSGACAVSLAIASGSRFVILLGYDAQLTGGRTHHHGDHEGGLRNCDTLPAWSLQFSRLAAWARVRGASVVNVSRETALTDFPRADVAETLAQAGAERSRAA